MFLEISPNSQENTCTRVSFFNKAGFCWSGTGVFLWILQNFSEHLRWLLLKLWKVSLSVAVRTFGLIIKVEFLKWDSYLPKNWFDLLYWKPFKNDQKCFFYFILEAQFILKMFKFLSWLFGHVGKTARLER